MFFDTVVKPDREAFLKNLRREGAPERVHMMELGADPEIKSVIINDYGLSDSIKADDPNREMKLEIALQRFLGYDYVTTTADNFEFTYPTVDTFDTVAGEQAKTKRQWSDSHLGLIGSWDEFENYPWPEIEKADTSKLEWLNKNLPDDMCIIASGCTHMFEWPEWLLGYEPLCMGLYDNPDLVRAVFGRVGRLMVALAELLVQFDRVSILFDGDDMGFKTSTMLSPDILREYSLPWHKRAAEIAHNAGKMYILHSCGELREIMDDLIDNIKIDGKHSFEDVITPVTEAKKLWGDRIAIIGGIDVDFLCRATIEEIRERVRKTLDVCMAGGGYCLGTGNSVANYIPVEKYLTMLDEGRKYAG